jgi:hypothetical protein
MADSVWFCHVGEIDREKLPAGDDLPMRHAVEAAYRAVTGREPQFIFSGWGHPLPEKYRAVVEDREPVPTGTVLIELERWRQVNNEGFTSEHDRDHDDGELAKAAACYALHAGSGHAGNWGSSPDVPYEGPRYKPLDWPWDRKWWKPSDNTLRDLVKAGALLAAEIDRRIAAGEEI